MAEYKTFEISFSTILENGKATATVYMRDNETEFKDKIEFCLNLDEINEKGGNYIDNIAEFLIGKATEQLIEQKKKYRSETFNAYID